jgi:hypothetical protein
MTSPLSSSILSPIRFGPGFLGLGLLGLVAGGGCTPTYTVPPDGGGSGDLSSLGDAAPLTWSATPDPNVLLQSEQRLPTNTQWREWKRDPSYLDDGGQQYLYFAGSPSPPPNTVVPAFTLGVATAADGQTLSVGSAQQVLGPMPGAWDQGNLWAPAVAKGAMALPKEWGMWYAADGAAGNPDYVTQIGVAFSDDGLSWTRSAVPAVAVTFSGANPTGSAPGAYGVTDPAIFVYSNSELWLYYAALDCQQSGCQFSIVRAATANGSTFAKGQVVLRGRPGVAAEAGGVAGPTIVQKAGTYYLAYTAVGQVPQKTAASIQGALRSGTVGLAQSTDGLNFTFVGTAPILGTAQDYDTGGAFAPALWLNTKDGSMSLYFSAFINGVDPLFSIGHATLQLN